jgi:hypothetical protein
MESWTTNRELRISEIIQKKMDHRQPVVIYEVTIRSVFTTISLL